jgi:hypothetical protein
MPIYDSVAKKMYVNLRSTNEIAEIDPASDSGLGTYAVDFYHGRDPNFDSNSDRRAGCSSGASFGPDVNAPSLRSRPRLLHVCRAPMAYGWVAQCHEHETD